MDDEEKGANLSESPADDKGANGAGSPTAEQLRAAQDAAEKYRKESSQLKDQLSSKEQELAELNDKVRLTTEEKERQKELQGKIVQDKKVLAQKARQMAESGDQNWSAVMALAEDIAEQIVSKNQEQSRKELTKKELLSDFEKRDAMLESEAKKLGKSVDEFKDLIDSYAKYFPSSVFSPSKQLEHTLSLFHKEQSLKSEQAKIDELKNQNSQFRDDGTGHPIPEPKGSNGQKLTDIGGWKNAKTEKEKEQALYAI